LRNLLAGILLTCACVCLSRATEVEGARFCILPEVPEAVERARAVFVGEVSEIIEPLTKDKKAPPPDRFYIIKFKVLQSWKGTTFFSEFSVLSAQGGHECFAYPAVKKGEKYLVFADPLYVDGIRQEGWSLITTCNRTKALSIAADDLKRLGPANRPHFDFRRSRKSKVRNMSAEHRAKQCVQVYSVAKSLPR